jgi:hypothetical protein
MDLVVDVEETQAESLAMGSKARGVSELPYPGADIPPADT